MSKGWIWRIAKALEGAGLVIILVGVLWSMRLGFADRGLESMSLEFQGLGIGGFLFLLGWILERRVGAR